VRADDAQTEAALLEILESFCSGFAARDADGVMQLFAQDADVVMVTSEESLLRGPDEIRAFLERYARGTTTYSWTWYRRDVSAAGLWAGFWPRARKQQRRKAVSRSIRIE
jgi:ketosteroid isomerase-like protein